MATRRIRSSSSESSTIVQYLLKREICGSSNSANVFGPKVPERLSMPMETILPAIALQNGHIFLGFTDCGRFLLSYTIREEYENAYNRNEMAFFYKLHIWLFVPYRPAKRVASIVLFSNSGVADNNLLIDVSQWRNDDSRLVIFGRNYSPEVGGVRSLFYVTLTTLPSTSACANCTFYGSRDVGDKCLRHCITTHLVYERVTPFPKFDFELQLRIQNGIVLNTGNGLHIFAYNLSRSQTGSTFVTELLVPPRHHESKKSKKRLLRCDFFFKSPSSTTSGLHKILSNCSAPEASRIMKTESDDLQNDDFELEASIAEQECFLNCIPLTMDFGVSPPSRRLSQSSLDSELSSFSAFSRSTNVSQESTAEPVPVDPPETELDPPKSPPKRFSSSSTTMPPPQPRRKFFKTGQGPATAALKKKPVAGTSYDIFEVGVDEVFPDRSLSSYRKRRNADKQYEFSDRDFSSENFLPLKLARKRGQNRRSRFQHSPVAFSPRGENSNPSPTDFLMVPRSPRGFTQSPAMSPTYTEMSSEVTVLRPLTNYPHLRSPTHPLFSPPLTRELCEDLTKSWFPANTVTVATAEVNPRSTFTTKANCIAKILRCYVDMDEDSWSVKTDTDDEYCQTVPFPVALKLDVHGAAYRSLTLIPNSKVNFSSCPVFEVMQRTLEIEILCNEVAAMICLAQDKTFIACFDYDVAVLDVCPDRGSITAVTVLLIYASKLSKETKHDTTAAPSPSREKYEAIFSFHWIPVEERCRIVYVGHMRGIETTPENWNPTKAILQRLKASGLIAETKQRVLSNELAVFEWKSLDELVDSTGLIRLVASGGAATSILNSRSNSVTVFESIDDDEDLSDY